MFTDINILAKSLSRLASKWLARLGKGTYPGLHDLAKCGWIPAREARLGLLLLSAPPSACHAHMTPDFPPGGATASLTSFLPYHYLGYTIIYLRLSRFPKPFCRPVIWHRIPLEASQHQNPINLIMTLYALNGSFSHKMTKTLIYQTRCCSLRPLATHRTGAAAR